MTTPRPDQRHMISGSSSAGSRSGSGDQAAANQYPGVPPAVINCQSAQIIQQNVGIPTFFTFTNPGRIWTVVLSYVITSNASFFLSTVRTFALVTTAISGTTLAIANIGVAGPSQHAEAICEPNIPGLPVVKGESLALSVNGGTTVPQLDQQASVLVLYSIP